MSIEVLQDNLCVNRLIEGKKKEITLESSIIVPDIKPDIVKPIDLSGNVCIYKKEIINGRVKVDGTIDSNIIYLVDSGDELIRGLNSNIDFSEFIEIDSNISQADIDANIVLKNMECDVLNGRKVNLKATIEISVRLYSNDGICILKDINGISGIQKLNKIVQLNSMVGKNTTKAIAKENILLNSEEKVMEILKKEVRIINKDFKVSYNKVVAKSELSVKILYLTEEGKINYVEKTIPIMGFIDMENVTEENICELKYCMKNILVKLNNTDENSIYLEVEVEISCYSYETKDIELVQDVYTPFSNIQYKQKTVKAMVGLQNINDIYQLKEQISDSEISNSRIYNVSTTSSINNVKIVGTKAIYEGEVSVNILYENTEVTRIDKKEFKFPINYELNILEGMSEENLDIMVDVEKYEISSQTDNIQINIDLNISTKMFKTIELNIIENLEEKDLEEKEEYSIIVYFVKAGDTLWNIAKKYRSTVENIKQINNIEDEDKLEINQQLFIPRYVEKVKAM